jgi:small subunit ribosomal protein S6
MVIEYIKDIRNYETTFLVKPGLDDAEYKDIIAKFTKFIIDNGGEVINQEIWGMRKLAYEIQRHSSAYYVFTEFRSNVDVNPVLEREYSFDERIIRYLTVKLDKDAAAWNERRRAKLKGQLSA